VPLLVLLLFKNTGACAHDEGDDTESGEGALARELEEWRVPRSGDGGGRRARRQVWDQGQRRRLRRRSAIMNPGGLPLRT
jgi:hypothetical protein